MARLRMGTMHDEPGIGRVWDRSAEGPYEVICPACGDDPAMNYADAPPEIQAIRGNYATMDDAKDALREHIGLRP